MASGLLVAWVGTSRRSGRTPVNKWEPAPRRMGATCRRISSISPALRYWRSMSAPPSTITSCAPAAASGLGQGGVDPLGDEDVGRAALLDDRFCGSVGDDEARRVEDWLFAPGSDAEVGHAPADDHRADGAEAIG